MTVTLLMMLTLMLAPSLTPTVSQTVVDFVSWDVEEDAQGTVRPDQMGGLAATDDVHGRKAQCESFAFHVVHWHGERDVHGR
jgi:hypothetical protein